MCGHEFSVRPSADDAHHAIGFLPTVNIRPQLRDFAGKLKSGDVLWNARRSSVSTSPLKKVGAIERRTAHVYEYFVRTGLRRGNVLDFQNLRSTETSHNNSSHGFILDCA